MRRRGGFTGDNERRFQRPATEPVMCDGGDRVVHEPGTWWAAEDVLLARCEGCGASVGTYLSGGRVWTQPHLRSDLAHA